MADVRKPFDDLCWATSSSSRAAIDYETHLRRRLLMQLAEQKYESDLRRRLLQRRRQILPESKSAVVGNQLQGQISVPRSFTSKHDCGTAEGRTRNWATLVPCKTSQERIKAKSQGSCSFEGPKPLTQLLKRKRKEQSESLGDGSVSGNETKRQFKRGHQISENTSVMPSDCQVDNQTSISKQEEEEQEEGLVSSGKNDELSKQGQISVPEMKGVEADNQTATSTKEGLISEETAELTYQGQPSVLNRSEVEEDFMMVIDKMEILHLKTFDKQGEENHSEQVDDAGDYLASEEAEYSDDEDDFAKKIAAMCGLPLLPCSN